MNATRDQRGFTYVAVLAVVATMGGVLAAFGEIASHAAQRERERELLFVGQEFRKAIAAYHRKDQRYPQALDQLLEDRRYPMPVRHLRRIYRDPITGSLDWGMVEAPEGGIMGVYSKSEEKPIKSGNFSLRNAAFEDASQYAEWKFVHVPPSPTGLGQRRAQKTHK
ncbi:MAG: type II secretion system protein [Burkholderiales bacterium]